jgi:hypothetical protein
MVNEESIWRSPKWLRKFMDFEISTGDDISDRAERLAQWDKLWREVDMEEFKKFFSEEYSEYVRNKMSLGLIMGSDLKKIREDFRGDMEMWDKFKKWILEEERKRKIQDDINRELNDLYSLLVSDFSKNPWEDKIETPRKGGIVCFVYKFETGEIFQICDNKLDWDRHTYTLGNIWRNKFIGLCNEMSSRARKRPTGSSSTGHKTGGSGDPNRDRYEKLKANIKLREEQLKKMPKSDPNRNLLENELDNYKRALARIKSKYKFENILPWGSIG